MPSPSPAPASNADLWDLAQRRERAGDPEGARRAYATLLRALLDARSPVPAYLCDRLASVCVELGEVEVAVTVFDAARKRMRQIGDGYGELRMGLALARAGLAAADVESAERFMGDAFGLGVALPELERLLAGVEGLAWPGHDAAETAMGRVDAALTLARLGAATGRFSSAVAAVELALRQLRGAEAFFSRSGMLLFLAELHLDRGDLTAAIDVERRLAAGDRDGLDGGRWALLAARRSCLAGRLSEARRALGGLLGGAGPLRRIDLQAAWLLAHVLTRLNRIGEARAILERVKARLGDSAADRCWARDVDALEQLVDRKRAGASRETALPFVPNQLWSDDTPGEEPARLSVLPEGTVERLARGTERFADRWTVLANGVLEGLDAGAPKVAEKHLVGLEALARGTDSARIAARTRYLRALVEHHGGDHRAARDRVVQCLEDARKMRLVLDELECLDLLVRLSAKLGDGAEHIRRATEAKRVLDQLTGALDEDDRAYLMLNRMTQQDTYVVARVASLANLARSRFPLPPLAAWLDRRRYRGEAVSRWRETGHLTGWDLQRRLAPDETPVGVLTPELATTSDQVEAWVREQIALVHRTKGRHVRPSFADAVRPLGHVPRRVAVLQYYAVATQLFAFVLTRGEIAVHSLPTTRVELNEAVRESIRSTVEQRDARLDGAEVAVALDRLARGAGISRILAALPSAIEHLVIVPHDTLVHAPFAALPFRGARLCERFTISYAPSARWIDLAAAARRRPLRCARFLGVAVGDYPGTELLPLPGALAEVRRIAGKLDAETWTLSGRGAQPQAILEALERVDVAHFACHGVFDRGRPHRSRLVVAGPGLTTGAVTLEDIQVRRLDRLRFAALASCWTGSAAVLPGGEVVCLPAAFLHAGAAAVMAPLWEVDDQIGAVFMTDFYEAAMRWPPARALAEVQRAWIHSGDRDRTMAFHWAAYQQHGQA